MCNSLLASYFVHQELIGSLDGLLLLQCYASDGLSHYGAVRNVLSVNHYS